MDAADDASSVSSGFYSSDEEENDNDNSNGYSYSYRTTLTVQTRGTFLRSLGFSQLMEKFYDPTTRSRLKLTWDDVNEFGRFWTAKARDFYVALHILDPPMPEEIMKRFITSASNEVLSKDNIQFLLQCPMMPLSLVQCFINKVEEEVLSRATSIVGTLQRAQSREGITTREYYIRLNASMNNRGYAVGDLYTRVKSALNEVLLSLRDPQTNVPPRLEVFKEILRPFFARDLFLDSKKFLTHAFAHPENKEYILIALDAFNNLLDDEVSKFWTEEEEDLVKDEIEAYEKEMVNSVFREVYVYREENGFDRGYHSPMIELTKNWNEDEATEFTKEILDRFEFSKEPFGLNVLDQAVRENKMKLARVLLERISFHARLENYYYWTDVMRSVFLQSIRNGDEPLTDFVLDIDLIISLVKKSLAYDFLHSSSNIFDCGCLLFYIYENQYSCHSITFLKRHDKDLEVCVPVIACIINMIKKSTNKEEKEFYTSNLFALLKNALNETKNWELVKYCLREHSKPIVSLKSKDQRILLHLISANKPAYDVFKMALDLGIKYKVGGKDGKGGLLVKNIAGETPLQLLSEQNAGAVNKIYNYISNFKELNLIDKSIYKKLDLLHHVAGSGKESLARKILKANPKLVSMVDENGQLPLHHACKRSASIEQRKMIKLLAQSGSKQKLTGKSGLLLADDQDVTPLENLVSFHPLTDKVYDVLFEVFDDVPVLQTAIESGCTNHINVFCMKNKQCLAVRDEWGCLPIHTCADLKGPPEDLPGKTELLKCIISHDPQALCERNGETGVFPFQSIASNEFYCLSLLYDVIRMEPSIVNSG